MVKNDQIKKRGPGEKKGLGSSWIVLLEQAGTSVTGPPCLDIAQCEIHSYVQLQLSPMRNRPTFLGAHSFNTAWKLEEFYSSSAWNRTGQRTYRDRSQKTTNFGTAKFLQYAHSLFVIVYSGWKIGSERKFWNKSSGPGFVTLDLIKLTLSEMQEGRQWPCCTILQWIQQFVFEKYI